MTAPGRSLSGQPAVRPRAAARMSAGRALRAAAALSLVLLAGGCAVASATAGAAISVTGAVVATGISLTGKAMGAGIDAVSSSPQASDSSAIVVRERIRPAEPASTPVPGCAPAADQGGGAACP